MENLFIILLLLSLLALGIGLVSPSLLTKILKKQFTRKNILVYFGGATVVFFIMFGIFSDSSPTPVVNNQPETQQIAEQQEAVNEMAEKEDILAPIQATQTPKPLDSTTAVPPPQQQTKTEPTAQPKAPQSNCVAGQVDINTASKEDLKNIIHIDDTRADDLIRLRPFKSVDTLTKINGIATARLNDIKTQGIACVQ